LISFAPFLYQERKGGTTLTKKKVTIDIYEVFFKLKHN